MCRRGQEIISSNNAFHRVSKKIIDIHFIGSYKKYYMGKLTVLIALFENVDAYQISF